MNYESNSERREYVVLNNDFATSDITLTIDLNILFNVTVLS